MCHSAAGAVVAVFIVVQKIQKEILDKETSFFGKVCDHPGKLTLSAFGQPVKIKNVIHNRSPFIINGRRVLRGTDRAHAFACAKGEVRHHAHEAHIASEQLAERGERLDGDDERLRREERLYIRRERGEVLRTHREEDHARGARDVLRVRRGAHVVAFREFLRACGNLLRHQDGLRVEALLARGGREDALGHLAGAEKSK